MGTFLTGYGDAGYEHEGYAAQVLNDGSVTDTYSSATRPRMIGQVIAACGCGWAGTTRYPCPEPFDEQAEDLALAEGETTHARPLLEQAQQDRAARLGQLLHGLAEEHRARLDQSGPGPTQYDLELLDRTLRTLATATDLARELRDQVDEQVHAAGQPRRDS
ncbi:MAG TPA: hypothetical protein VHH34_16080 [Pseudonocardiaceae bacterium]|nr:hypothetical protein [Pseudonocardiaceae bacterium]